MKRYDRIVLNKLLDSWENSAGYRAAHYNSTVGSNVSESSGCVSAYRDTPSVVHRDNTAGDILRTDKAVEDGAVLPAAPSRRRGIFCRIDKKSFPDYFDTASGTYETLHHQLEELERKGLIKLHWRDKLAGHILEKVELVTDSADSCYTYLGRNPKCKKEAAIKGICEKYRQSAALGSTSSGQEENGGRIETLVNFTDRIVQRLQSGESIKQYADIDDPGEFERLCKLLSAVLANEEDTYLRQFSIAVFNDSKIAERELGKAASVIREFSKDPDINDDLSTDEIMELHGIYRNPVWMYMKGHAVFRLTDEYGNGRRPEAGHPAEKSSAGLISAGLIDIEKLENGIGITLRDLELVEPVTDNYPNELCPANASPECVLTIENLTSYYQQDITVQGMKALVIYLGGYAGRKKRRFLQKLKTTYPNAVFMHSGDIDCGGFRIWKSLTQGTGIPFTPYRMDIDTFDRYKANGKTLTEHDRVQLEEMMKDPFYTDQHELFEKMKTAGLKLEQESFF